MLNYLLVFLLLLALVGIGVLAMVIDSGVSDKHKKSLAYGLFGLFGVIGVVFMMVEDKSAFVYGDWSSGPKAAKKKQTKHYEVTEKAGEAVEEDVQITRKADPGTLLDDGTAGDGKKSADGMASRCPACPIMVELTGGSSVIGTLFREVGEGGLELGPMQEITLPKFAISKMEITVGQFEAFVKDKGYKPANVCRAGSETISGEAWRRPGFEQGQDSPVVCVSFYDAMEFANYLTQKTGQRYSLPTEAEWEYAARAGSYEDYSTGRQIVAQQAHFRSVGQTKRGTMPVGSFAPNKYGVYDAHGNASELVRTCHDRADLKPISTRPGDPPAAAPRGALDMAGCTVRMLKGGAWYSPAGHLHASSRAPISLGDADHGVGFRVVRYKD